MNKLSNNPPKGTRDWEPEEFFVRKYIFDTWRKVCTQFGYEEYLTPIVERAEIYKAKSGEDVGGKELMFFEDKAGRELAIRPEMTPSVTRMVSGIYGKTAKPIRLFSIANFFRNEKPQRGRNREFWQLNYDLFGDESINADIEILQIALEIMLAFNPPKKSFTLYLNNRILIDGILEEIASVSDESRVEVVRILDKWEKYEFEAIENRLEALGLEKRQIENLQKFIQSDSAGELESNFPEIVENEGFKQIKETMQKLDELGYSDWVVFKPNVIRGFDYYDGMVFEVFDNNPENKRAMFGGGRYNGLAELFGSQSFPAVGSAPGDETLRIFLEDWNLIPELDKKTCFIPLLEAEFYLKVQELASSLRQKGDNVVIGLEPQSLGKALDFANKQGYSKVLILGENEIAKGIYTEKDMKTGEQREIQF
jgi:histidyl-tRNA synthetase